MVKEMISDGTGNAVELEGDGDGDTLEVSVYIQEYVFHKDLCLWFSTSECIGVCLCICFCTCVLQYEYDINEKADRVVLGRGTYGVVYAGSLSVLLRSKWGLLKEATIVFFTQQISLPLSPSPSLSLSIVKFIHKANRML